MGERELTFGEKAVGLTFNPGNNPEVDAIKKAAAAFIDICDSARNGNTANSVNGDVSPEVKRMYSVAITEAQTAQMWAVKAATWKN